MHTHAATGVVAELPLSAAAARVAVAGATGYAGQELVALLARHPAVTSLAAYRSDRSGSRRVPGWAGEIQPLDPQPAGAAAALAAAADVVFLALPEAASAALAPALVADGARVIDLSGAFRIVDPATRARWYPETRDADGAVYGLTERRRVELRAARLVACPGCYPTAALLAVEPLAEAGLLADGSDIVIDAKSGISGAGRSATERTHFCECHGNVSTYGVFNHRHTAEMEQELRRPVTFVPQLVPLDRGILETIYLRVRRGVTDADLSSAFGAAYDGEPFVGVCGAVLPSIRDVAFTNRCDIGWALDAASARLVVVSCLDNLRKGAASQAVQNFNVMMGLDETAGLLA
jgi:N-acetyl-gamma-glutamyl-phosphate reductase